MKEQNATLSLLKLLKEEIPEVWEQAQVVGKWVWLEFNVAPVDEIRTKLKKLGFHWNGKRKCWQHPCSISRSRSGGDPRSYYQIKQAPNMAVNERLARAKEYKVISLRECPLPESMEICEQPQQVADYWRLNISTNPYFDPERECFAVLMLNTRYRVKGHQFVTIGTMDTLLVSPTVVFRVALIASASKIVMVHNHPSGDPSPSEADIKVTRDLIRAGILMKIDVLDHVIIGTQRHSSLRELGHF